MRPRRFFAQTFGIALVISLLITCCMPQATPTPDPEISSTRVLFIGNSLTFINNLPEMFAELAQSGGHNVAVDMSAQGGWTCADHATSALTLDKIGQQEWDFVVLQEQSEIPAIAEQRTEHMYPAVRILDKKIRERGANTVLFMTWGRWNALHGMEDGAYADLQAQVKSGYMEIANELDAMVAPVGVAWQSGIAQNPQLGLWQADGIHPTREGTYLSACIFFAVIFQQSPEDLRYTAGLSGERARFLQAVAAGVVLENPADWNIP